jgi:hypothetical protein
VILTRDPITPLADGMEIKLGVSPKTAAGMTMDRKTMVVPGNDYLFKTTSSLYNDV